MIRRQGQWTTNKQNSSLTKHICCSSVGKVRGQEYTCLPYMSKATIFFLNNASSFSSQQQSISANEDMCYNQFNHHILIWVYK